MAKLVSVKPADGIHKFVAHFITDKGKDKHIKFGLKGYEHFTNGNGYKGHLDEERRQRYVDRHRKHENWSNPMTAGSLSYHLLWLYPDFEEALKKFRQKFHL
jgi:hypothetical protein